MPKCTKTYTIDVDLCEALRKFADGRSMSALVEEGIRLRLGMPSVPAGAADPEAEASTGTERRMLSRLGKAGPGWHFVFDLANAVGVSPHVGLKALKDLEDKGQAFRWGDSMENYDGSKGGGCWGSIPGVTTVERLIELWRRQGADSSPGNATMITMVQRIREMALGMDDASIEQCNRLLVVALQASNYEQFALENFAAQQARKTAESDAEQRRLDAEHRAQREV